MTSGARWKRKKKRTRRKRRNDRRAGVVHLICIARNYGGPNHVSRGLESGPLSGDAFSVRLQTERFGAVATRERQAGARRVRRVYGHTGGERRDARTNAVPRKICRARQGDRF